MSLGDDLRKERVREIYDAFHSSSRDYEWLHHVCARSEDQRILRLLCTVVREKSREELWSKVLLGSTFKGNTGYRSECPHLLRIGPAAWYGRYSDYAEYPDEVDKAVAEFARLAREALVDFERYAQSSSQSHCPGFRTPVWLEVLYAAVRCPRKVVRLDAPGLPEGSVEIT